MEGLNDGTPIYVAAYPVAWRIELDDDDDAHRGFEYVRWEPDIILERFADTTW